MIKITKKTNLFFEILEQGAKAHGMGEREIEKMVGKLNSLVNPKS